MADDGKELKIHVVTTADTAGLTKTEEEFAAVEARLTGVYQGARDVRQAFGEFDRILPGLGSSMMAVFTGPLGWFAAAADGIFLLTEQMRHLSDATERAAAAQAKLNAKVYDEIADAQEKVAENNQVYADFLDKLKEKTDALREAEELRNTVLEAQAQGEAKILDAEEQMELAGAKGNSAKEEQIRQKYETLRAQIELAAAAQKTAEDKQNVANAQSAVDEARKKADAAVLATNAGKLFITQNGDAIAKDEAKRDELMLQAAALQEQIKHDQVASSSNEPSMGPGGALTTAGVARERLAVDKASLQTIQHQLQLVTDWQAKQKQLEDNQAERQSKLQQATTDLNSAQQKLLQDSAKQTIQQQTDAIVSMIKTTGITPEMAGGAFASDKNYYSGQPSTQAQMQALSQMKAMLEQHGLAWQQVLELMLKFAAQGKTVTDVLPAIASQINRQQQQLASVQTTGIR